MVTLRLQAFGPLRVEVEVDGRSQTIAQRRERVLLATLIAARGASVSTDRLIDELWGSEAPSRATTSLQVAVSRLRGLLEPERERRSPATVLVSDGAGYALRATAAQVDVWQFEEQAAVTLAATNDVARLDLASAALSLYEAGPYADGGDGDLVRAAVTRLIELRLAVIEAKADALLGLGRPAEAVRELEQTAEEHPFREQLWSLLALAYYRSLRQADALATLRTLRARLDDELGVDPTPDLQRLEEQILNQSATIAGPPPADPRSDAKGTDQATAPIIGRTGPLAVAQGALDRLRAEQPGAVMISGEAGIGKSRLAAATAEQAERMGFTVVLGRCHEAEVAPAYWPWLPILERLTADHDDPAVTRLLQAQTSSEEGDSGAAALRTYDAVTRALAQAATRNPWVIILEDLHWADPSSLRLLGYAVENLQAPVLLVGTRRTADLPVTPALTAALAALARAGAERIRLTGLRVDEVTQLLETWLPGQPEELSSTLLARTDGNPFFIIEFARLLASQGEADAQVPAAEIPVPEGIRDLLRLRIARLPENTRSLLEVASVAGRVIDPRLLGMVTGQSLVDVLDGLDQATASGLVAHDGGRHLFAHALVRETWYGDIPAGRRIRLHAGLADALEARLATDPELVVEVAHHYWQAAPLDPSYAAKAVAHTIAAAQMAEARNGFAESVALRGRALAASEFLDEVDPLDRYRWLADLALAELRIGEMVGARDHVGAAVAIARAADRWDLVAQAAVSLIGAGVWSWREAGSVDEVMIDSLLACVEQLPDGGLKARVLASLQMEYYHARRFDQAELYGQRSVELARQVGDPELLLRVLLVRSLTNWAPGTHLQRIALAEEMLSLPAVGEMEVSVLWQYGTAMNHAGRDAEAEAAMVRAQQAAARLRHTGADIPIAWWKFMRAVEREDPQRAEIGRAALDLHRRTTFVASTELSGIYTLRSGEIGDPVPPEVVELGRQSPNPAFRALVAHALVEAGDPGLGMAILGPDGEEDARDFAALASDCLRTAVYAAAGRLDDTRRMLARVSRWSGDVVTWGSVDHLGAIDYFIALGQLALGEVGEAEQRLRAAIELCDRVGNRVWARRARMQLAALDHPDQADPADKSAVSRPAARPAGTASPR